MTSRSRPERATEREVGVVAAILVAGSEKAAAHRLGLSHSTVKHHLASARSKVGATTTAQLVWILAPRLPEPEGEGQADESTRAVVVSPVIGATRPRTAIPARTGASQRRERAVRPRSRQGRTPTRR